MIGTCIRTAGFMLWLGLWAGTSAAAGYEQCHRAAQTASRETGVPLDVLLAVSLTETGRKTGEKVQPWPWALNAAGAGHWHPTRQDALAMAQSLRAQGHRNFDLGCFQINYRWHGESFASLDDMLDPEQNALYAARFLSRLFAELGDWSSAAGRFHSATPHLAHAYRQRFDRYLASVTGTHLADDPGYVPVATAVRENRFPLLNGGAASIHAGSLMPQVNSGAPFLRAAAKPFWTGS